LSCELAMLQKKQYKAKFYTRKKEKSKEFSDVDSSNPRSSSSQSTEAAHIKPCDENSSDTTLL